MTEQKFGHIARKPAKLSRKDDVAVIEVVTR